MQQQQEQDQEPQQHRRFDTAREAAKDLIRSYVLDGWMLAQLTKGHMSAGSAEYEAQIGAVGGSIEYKGLNRSVSKDEIVVTRVGKTACFALFDIPELMAEIRDEARGYRQITLAEIFAQQDRERIALAQRQEEEEEQGQQQEATQSSKRPPAVYRA